MKEITTTSWKYLPWKQRLNFSRIFSFKFFKKVSVILLIYLTLFLIIYKPIHNKCRICTWSWKFYWFLVDVILKKYYTFEINKNRNLQSTLILKTLKGFKQIKSGSKLKFPYTRTAAIRAETIQLLRSNFYFNALKASKNGTKYFISSYFYWFLDFSFGFSLPFVLLSKLIKFFARFHSLNSFLKVNLTNN